jgi:hypothetical protein
MKPLIIQFSPPSCYFCLLGLNILLSGLLSNTISLFYQPVNCFTSAFAWAHISTPALVRNAGFEIRNANLVTLCSCCLILLQARSKSCTQTLPYLSIWTHVDLTTTRTLIKYFSSIGHKMILLNHRTNWKPAWNLVYNSSPNRRIKFFFDMKCSTI